MWERLAFYTMVGILLLYTLDAERGGLGLPAAEGNAIYGLYLAFVYLTPFLGGLIADRLLGYRRAVALGGLLMGAGLMLMSVRGYAPFVGGLALLVVGNGFFKPNISVMVGNLYEPGDPKRDLGFNIFYMGINIGALTATLIAAPVVRNVWGWLWTFRAAGFGVLIGVVILLAFWRTLANADHPPERDPDDTSFGEIFGKILVPAVVIGVVGYAAAVYVLPGMGINVEEFGLRPAVFGSMCGMIPVLIFLSLLHRRARPEEKAGLRVLPLIYLAGATFFMILHLNGSAMTQWARDFTDREGEWVPAAVQPYWTQDALPSYYVNAPGDVLRPSPESLLLVEDTRLAKMFGQQALDESAAREIAEDPSVEMIDVTEGADLPAQVRARAVPIYPDGTIKVEQTTDAHGAPIVEVRVPEGSEQLREVAFVREVMTPEGPTQIAAFVVDREVWDGLYQRYIDRYGEQAETMRPGRFLRVINPEIYQSWNPFWVILLTPFVVLFFGWRQRKGKPMSTAHKIFYGLVLTTISLLFMMIGGYFTDAGLLKVSGLWLAIFYAIITLGELLLSPMGLSLVTKLTPKRMVGLTMGGWFVAVAFGNLFSGFFGGIQYQMEPMWFFFTLAVAAAVVAAFIRLVLPVLDRAIRQYGA
jgi:dipeptide/tripeptide permease